MCGERHVPRVLSFSFSSKSEIWKKMLKPTSVPDMAIPKSSPLTAMAEMIASMTVMIVVSILLT